MDFSVMQAEVDAQAQLSQRLTREVQAAEQEQQFVHRRIAMYNADCMLMSVQNQRLQQLISFLTAVSVAS